MSEERTHEAPADDDLYVDERTHWPQIIGSIIVAIAIVAVTLLITTAQFGTTSSAELEGREDAMKERQEMIEERQEAAQERREEAAE